MKKEITVNCNTCAKELLAGEKCIGCGACEKICSFGAIKMLKTDEGFTYAFVLKDKCVNCGKCKKVCPVMGEIGFNKTAKKVYAFKAADDIRKLSASGGAFAALAENIIDRGGVVFGAIIDEFFSVKHIGCADKNLLSAIQGTKYVQSDISGCFTEIEDAISNGQPVLFTSTPCQTYAVKKYLSVKGVSTEKLYLADIICHGVPSPEFFKDFVKWLSLKYKGELKEYKFRSKRISWRGNSCVAIFKDGRELLNDKYASAFMNVYYSGNITRECCYGCKFSSLDRISDITISDYWGIEDVAPEFEDGLGVSMTIVNTAKGEELFNSVSGEKIAGDLSKAKQPQLFSPCDRPNKRTEFWELYKRKGVNACLKKYGGLGGGVKIKVRAALSKLCSIFKKRK